MESLGYKQKNKMVYQMIESMKQKSIDFDQFLDMMTARIVRTHIHSTLQQQTHNVVKGGKSTKDGKTTHGVSDRVARPAWQPLIRSVLLLLSCCF